MDFYRHFLAWPDSITGLSTISDGYEGIAVDIQTNSYTTAENRLLCMYACNPSRVVDDIHFWSLFVFLRCKQNRFSQAKKLLQRVSEIDKSSWQYYWLSLCLAGYNELSISDQEPFPGHFVNASASDSLIKIAWARIHCQQGYLDQAYSLITNPSVPRSPEAVSVLASIYAKQRKYDVAYCTLAEYTDQTPHSSQLIIQALEYVINAKLMDKILPLAHKAYSLFGEIPELLNTYSAIKLYQRQPALARRCSLLLQIWSSVSNVPFGMANQICSYEQCGNTEWLDNLIDQIFAEPSLSLITAENLAMHLASIESRRYPLHVTRLVKELAKSSLPDSLSVYSPRNNNISAERRQILDQPEKKCIAWICADFTPHPVSRFLHHFFANSDSSRIHAHTFVSLANYGTASNLHEFAEYSDTSIVDISALDLRDRIHSVRDISADVVIDLSGWTANNFSIGMLAKLAPVQVNYLGYFASTGLPTTDFWLGDKVLFKRPFQEWHTESLCLLNRPFLAWKPPSFLPEGQVSVPEGPVHHVRFGTFNHTRKLSSRSLKLWSRILSAVPNSSLVLKASSTDDVSTRELLASRLRAAGIDPSRVEWLSLTPSCIDHLYQYSRIDISLDPLPNGGCTTTCESLWMGVPVITLYGDNYVSRMSSAVLIGAGLEQYVAYSEQEYLHKAIELAHQVQAIRANRGWLRACVEASPLGDVEHFMRCFENTLSELSKGGLTR